MTAQQEAPSQDCYHSMGQLYCNGTQPPHQCCPTLLIRSILGNDCITKTLDLQFYFFFQISHTHISVKRKMLEVMSRWLRLSKCELCACHMLHYNINNNNNITLSELFLSFFTLRWRRIEKKGSVYTWIQSNFQDIKCFLFRSRKSNGETDLLATLLRTTH